MFDAIAARYDMVNDLASLGQCRLWTAAVAHALQHMTAGLEGRQVLDVACGTGTSSLAIARRGARVVGCDISDGMLSVARNRSQTSQWGQRLRYRHANAMELPFPDNSFDAVTSSYGLRNMSCPQEALQEMRRVARAGAPVVILDFDLPRNPLMRACYQRYARMVLPLLGQLMGSGAQPYRYLNDSIANWRGAAGVCRMLHDAGFRDIRSAKLCLGIASICTARA